MRDRWLLAGLGFAVLAATSAYGDDPPVSLHVIPAPAGFERFDSESMSGNGDVVIGRLNRFGGGITPAKWTATEGFTPLPLPAGMTSAIPNSVSFDGSVITASGPGSLFYRSFRWTQSGGTQLLGVPAGHSQFVTVGTSYDGQRSVGNAELSLGSRAYRWQVGTGFTNLGTISSDPRTEVFAISGNGLVAAGRFESDDGGFPEADVCYWTDQTGLVRLPALLGATDGIPYAVSEHGEAIAGRMSGNGWGPDGRAFYWTEALGTIEIGRGTARAISSDGRVVAGDRAGSTSREVWVWSPETGRVTITSILFSNGIDLTGWEMYSVNAISADGLTVLGRGRLNGVEQNWIAQIPSPSTAVAALVCIGVYGNRRRRHSMRPTTCGRHSERQYPSAHP